MRRGHWTEIAAIVRLE